VPAVQGRADIDAGAGVPQRPVPHPRRVARDSFTGRACGQEVTVGDAPAVALPAVRDTIRRSIGDPATKMPDVSDAIVDAVLRLWPSEWMTCLARSKSFKAGEQAFYACELVRARCLEYLEWRYGTSANVRLAISLLLKSVVDEVAMFWLEGPEHRNVIRQAIAAIRRADRA
jgi:hypothetical protein